MDLPMVEDGLRIPVARGRKKLKKETGVLE